MDLQEILTTLCIYSDDYWNYISPNIKAFDLPVETAIWGTFTTTDDNNLLTGIKILVPVIKDEKTLLINIHEHAHAFTLYQHLGQPLDIEVASHEEYARGKEQEYLLKKGIIK